MKALIYKALSTWWSLARQQTVSLQLFERCDNYMANSVTSLSMTPTWQSLLLTARGIPPSFVGWEAECTGRDFGPQRILSWRYTTDYGQSIVSYYMYTMRLEIYLHKTIVSVWCKDFLLLYMEVHGLWQVVNRGVGRWKVVGGRHNQGLGASLLQLDWSKNLCLFLFLSYEKNCSIVLSV